MQTAPKLPDLDTFNNPAQLPQLRALRSTVLKSRRDYFASVTEGNSWIGQLQKRIDALVKDTKRAPHANVSMQPRSRSAEIDSHKTVTTVPPIKHTEGAPRVKVLNDPLGSHRPKGTPLQPTQSARTPQAAQAARVLPAAPRARVAPLALPAPAAPPLTLFAALESKYRQHAMMTDLFSALRQADIEARHNNATELERCLQDAEHIDALLRIDLAKEGAAFKVARPVLDLAPANPDDKPTTPDATS